MPTKKMSGRTHHAGDFLVVEDPEKPATWHLPVKVNGTPNRRLAAAAWAALFSPGGFRGNKYSGPNAQEAKAKLKRLYKAQGWVTPTEESTEENVTEYIEGSLEDFIRRVRHAFYSQYDSDNPDLGRRYWVEDILAEHAVLANSIIVSEERNLWAVRYVDTGQDVTFDARPDWKPIALSYVLLSTEVQPAEANVSLAESWAGTLNIEEGLETNADGAPLVITAAIIEPGWGNDRDNNYYPSEMLAEYAEAFVGAKMYATDHRPHEKSVRTEVSQILGIAGFTETGAPIARIGVFDPIFAESVRNRAKLKKASGATCLEDLACSVLARGMARKGEVDGKAGHIVESITEVQSVDWVTRAGAGGRALTISESREEFNEMAGEKKEPTTVTTELEEKTIKEAGPVGENVVGENVVGENVVVPPAETSVTTGSTTPITLSLVEVSAALNATRLPDVAKARLLQRSFTTSKELAEAIEAEATYISNVVRAGRPFGLGETQPPEATTMTVEEYDQRVDEIFLRHGVTIKEGDK